MRLASGLKSLRDWSFVRLVEKGLGERLASETKSILLFDILATGAAEKRGVLFGENIEQEPDFEYQEVDSE